MEQPYILLIDTSTTVCSAALAKGGKIIGIREVDEPNVHASRLTLMIASLMEEHRLKYTDLDSIAVAKGPGSYTGLRIGVSVAKGICYAANLPLLAIDSLLSLTNGFLSNYPVASQRNGEGQTLFSPMIDARRMEVYRAIYTDRLEVVRPTAAVVIDSGSFDDVLAGGQDIVLFGNGADKLAELFMHQPGVQVVSGFTSSARAMAAPAFSAFCQGEFVDLAYFEPYYLKDFIPTSPRKNPGAL